MLDQREEALKPFQLKREKVAILDFSCYLCTKAFKDQDTLLLHHKIKHSSSPRESHSQNKEPSVEIYDSEEE